MASQGVNEGLTQSIVQRFPPCMQGRWCGHGAPVVFNGEDGGKRFDLFSTHVNDERQVVGIAVSLNSQTFNVNPSTRKRCAESLVVQQTSGQGGDERFHLFVREEERDDDVRDDEEENGSSRAKKKKEENLHKQNSRIARNSRDQKEFEIENQKSISID